MKVSSFRVGRKEVVRMRPGPSVKVHTFLTLCIAKLTLFDAGNTSESKKDKPIA